MFGQLTSKLGDVFSRLGRKGVLSEEDVTAALREVRVALLEADVALPVVKEFIEKAKERATGQDVLRAVKPDQQVIKIVSDLLTEMLGGDTVGLELNVQPPAVILMVGLQGSGKTTSTAKLAKYLFDKERKKTLIASLDVQRPAAQEQLEILAGQISAGNLPIIKGQTPEQITTRALATARAEGYDVLILDTAGRLAIDDELMAEVARVRDLAKPQETLLVADAMTGQDAVNTARAFHEKIGLSGIILTRLDGDARGGAALSMRTITGQPIKFMGLGEKLDALEPFHPSRIAGRILDMGDIVALVEKAVANIDEAEAQAMADATMKGEFDFNTMASQFRQMKKMGGFGSILNLLPGMGQIKDMLASAKVDESIMDRQLAMISSMTPLERRNPDIIKASRKKRIAAGAGSDVQELNKLMKQFYAMQDAMKRFKKMGGAKGLQKHGLSALMPAMKQRR